MHLSSVLVYIQPEYFSQVYSELCTYPYLKIHYRCENTGCMVLVQHLDSNEEHLEGLKVIKSTDHVLSADFIYSRAESGHSSPSLVT